MAKIKTDKKLKERELNNIKLVIKDLNDRMNEERVLFMQKIKKTEDEITLRYNQLVSNLSTLTGNKTTTVFYQ